MELRLVGAEGVRRGSLVAVKVGGKKSYVPLDDDIFAKGVCRFPGLTGPQQVKLDVYEHVAQARLVAEPAEARWAVSLAPPTDAPEGGAPNAPMFLELEMKGPGAAEDNHHTPREDGSAERSKHQKALIAAKSQPYFEQHNLIQVVQTLLQSVIKETPPDPYAYMIQVLQNTSRCASAASGSRAARPSTAQACRRPPAAAADAKTRPRSAVARAPASAIAAAAAASAGAAPPRPTAPGGREARASGPSAPSASAGGLRRQPSPLPAMISPRKPSAPISPANLRQASPRAVRSAPRLGGGGGALGPGAGEGSLRPFCVASEASLSAAGGSSPRGLEEAWGGPAEGSTRGWAPQGAELCAGREELDPGAAFHPESPPFVERARGGCEEGSKALRRPEAAPEARPAPSTPSRPPRPASPGAAAGTPAPRTPQTGPDAIARTAGRMPAHAQSAPSLRMPRLLPKPGLASPRQGPAARTPAAGGGDCRGSHTRQEEEAAGLGLALADSPHGMLEDRDPRMLRAAPLAKQPSSQNSLAISQGGSGLSNSELSHMINSEPFCDGPLRELSGISSVHDSPR